MTFPHVLHMRNHVKPCVFGTLDVMTFHMWIFTESGEAQQGEFNSDGIAYLFVLLLHVEGHMLYIRSLFICVFIMFNFT